MRAAVDADDMLFLKAEAQLRGIEYSIYNVEAVPLPIIDQLRLAVRADDEQRGSFACRERRGELDISFLPIIERAPWPPCWLVAADRIAEIELLDRKPGGNWRRSQSRLGLAV